MTQPTSACLNRMQVHSLRQETPDFWTLSLINHDFYPYRPGQYALVCIASDPDTLRAYTLSSTPGLSPFITLTVRRLEPGTGSGWLTQQVKPGDYLWLSDAQGKFTCVDAGHGEQERYLMLAAGCGVTPIMSMSRWLLAQRPNVHLQVIFNVRNPQQVIFAAEWQRLTEQYHSQLTLTLVAEFDAEPGFLGGRLTPELLKQAVPDLAQRIVMTCGPAPYMQHVAALVADAGVTSVRFYKEQFQIGAESLEEDGEQLTLTIRQPLNTLRIPVGITLLAALESHKIPVNAACRAGVCGSCKTKVLSGDYTTSSTMTLTADEIAQGYVLACSCQLHGDTVLA